MDMNSGGLRNTGLLQLLIEQVEKLRLRKAKLKPKDGEYLAEVEARNHARTPPVTFPAAQRIQEKWERPVCI